MLVVGGMDAHSVRFLNWRELQFPVTAGVRYTIGLAGIALYRETKQRIVTRFWPSKLLSVFGGALE
jgi:hypothetical protein